MTSFSPPFQPIEDVKNRDAIQQCDLEKDSQIPKVGSAPVFPEDTFVIEQKVKRPAHDVVRQR